MANGRVRQRNVLPSEKMFHREDPSLACERGLMEELGMYITNSSMMEVRLQLLWVVRDAVAHIWV